MQLFRTTIDQQPWPAFLPHFMLTSFTRIEIKSIVQWTIDNKKGETYSISILLFNFFYRPCYFSKMEKQFGAMNVFVQKKF